MGRLRHMSSRDDLLLQDDETVLFIGDSITDAGRRADTGRRLGSGYVAQVADLLAVLYPERRISITTRASAEIAWLTCRSGGSGT